MPKRIITCQTYYLGLLGEALERHGQTEEGSRAVEEALALAQQTGERLYEAELHRLRGELLLRRSGESDSSGAEARFQQALAIARDQKAAALELRAAMSLGRLYRNQGRPADARNLLGTTHRQFTEGFQTHDLQQAKALLSELS